MPNNLSKKELADIIQWDVRNWKKTLAYWNQHFEIKPGMKVLALGEREGGMSLYFAKLGCEVVCSDYNDFPDTTIDFHKSYGVDHLITYAKIDMCNIDLDSEQFDIVVFKSVIGALAEKENQDKGVSEIYRVLKKGGAFLFAENASGSKMHQSLRNRFTAWNKYWRYPNKKDVQDWSQCFSSFKTKNHGFFGTFGRSEKQRALMGAVDTVVSPVLPSSWKYITFGVMIK